MTDNFINYCKKAKLNHNTYLRVTLSQDNQTSLDKVAEELYGNIGLVEISGHNIPSGEFLDFAQKVKQLCAQFDKTLIIRERLDIAKIVEADGIFLTNNDIPAKYIYNILPKDIIIGSDDLENNDSDYYLLNSPLEHNITKPCFIKTKPSDDFEYYTLFK